MSEEVRKKHKGVYSKEQKLEVMVEICEILAGSTSGMKSICASHDYFPESQTVFRWMFNERIDTSDEDKPLNALYAQAKESQMAMMADDLLSITDDDSRDTDEAGRGNNAAVNRDRLKVDTRKWIMSKLDRRTYGDKAELEVTDHSTINHTQMMREAQRRAATGQATAASDGSQPLGEAQPSPNPQERRH